MSFFSHAPVIGVLEALVHEAAGNHRLAKEAAANTLESNSRVPGVGHLQAGIQILGGDRRGAERSVTNAQNSTRAVVSAATRGLANPLVRLSENVVSGFINQGCVFPQSGESEVAKLSAFCAKDVYFVRKRGGRNYPRVALNKKNFEIRCQQRAFKELFYAEYKIGNCVFLAFRGTDDCLTDYAKDVHIAVGTFGTLFNLIENVASPDDLKTKYGVSRVYVTGHSLGGSQALAYASQHYFDIDGCYIFNPGRGLWNSEGLPPTAEKVMVYNINGDLVSAFGGWSLPVKTFHAVSGCGPHSMDNFTINEKWDDMIEA
mmetsp:Transcript_7879/g.12848  ORF Transcript_7879/g.12848 Transcript_7879/m.12848 type:complete len:316 (+) Transcript_7879:53-1000(+)